MGKHKPHPAGRPPKKVKPSEEDEEKGTIFFYMPNEKPHGVFCQWHPSPFSIPIASLQWLVDLAPAPPSSSTSSMSTATISASDILTNHASTSPGNPNPFLSFTCAEQSYMYCKSLFFSDLHICSLILSTPDPKTQKKHGQRVTNFSFAAWTTVKSRVARMGNWYKFTGGNEHAGKGAGNGNRHMRSVLLGTGVRELAEAGRRDRVWGIGYRAFEAEGYRDWWGENLLGVGCCGLGLGWFVG
ncbi:hypothetical protein BKA58DRAFT_363974 [Alternaria rosae]|uniref:uncharacterized protein n=1 Tax=Alternaria rosae TaxID=1187941 RepID=UPI001E8EE490|nr:uncharacterized protein BKA58DRAFT_363974 [Alternaria rosae]KAH6866533.1 hypothetical protein BKA58DRAFT_363974 [Alternaria rosae]